MNPAMLRTLRKQMLQLQAEQFRMALRQDLVRLNPPAPSGPDHSAWLETAGNLLGAVLPGKWGRWLNVGLSAWRIGKRVLAKSGADPQA